MIPVSCDLETALIAPRLLAPPVTCLAVAGDGATRLHHVSEGPGPIARLLERRDVLTVWHNGAAFDLACLLSEWPELAPPLFAALRAGRVSDTRIREQLLDVAAGTLNLEAVTEHGEARKRRKSYSLEQLVVSRGLGEPWKNEWRLRYAELRGVPLADWPREALEYPPRDVERTLSLWRDQGERAAAIGYLDPDGSGLVVDEARKVRSSFALHLSSCWGARVDQARVDRLERECRFRADELRGALVDAGLIRPDGSRRVKAARARAVDVAGARVRLTPKGAASVSKHATAWYGDELLVDYSDLAEVRAALDKDVPLMRAGVLQTRYGMAETGRTTSSAPNLQNLRRLPGVRECVAARPGRVLVVADLGTGELRTWAQACLWLVGRSELARVLRAGGDPHASMGAAIARVDEREMLRAVAAGDARAKKYRQLGKHVNFGFPGGMGARTFVNLCWTMARHEVTLEQSREYRDAWLERWPEASDYFRHAEQLGEPATVEQLGSGRRRGGCWYTEVCNGYFQGLLADLALDATWRLCERSWVGSGALARGRGRLVVFNHDEWLYEVDEAWGHEAAEEVRGVVLETATTWTPDVPASVEPLLARRWSKAAERVVDEGGRLVPWDEEAAA